MKGVLVCALVCALLVALSGCIRETPTVPATPAPQPTVNPQKSQKLELKVGRTAQTSHIAVTVRSADKKSQYTYYSDIWKEYRVETADAGKIFVDVFAEIKNIGDSTGYMGSSSFSMTDAEGYKYDPEIYMGDDELERFQELYPGQKMDGRMIFLLPEAATGLRVEYDFGNILTGPSLASWVVS